jgi:hypothetical protein
MFQLIYVFSLVVLGFHAILYYLGPQERISDESNIGAAIISLLFINCYIHIMHFITPYLRRNIDEKEKRGTLSIVNSIILLVIAIFVLFDAKYLFLMIIQLIHHFLWSLQEEKLSGLRLVSYFETMNIINCLIFYFLFISPDPPLDAVVKQSGLEFAIPWNCYNPIALMNGGEIGDSTLYVARTEENMVSLTIKCGFKYLSKTLNYSVEIKNNHVIFDKEHNTIFNVSFYYGASWIIISILLHLLYFHKKRHTTFSLK